MICYYLLCLWRFNEQWSIVFPFHMDYSIHFWIPLLYSIRTNVHRTWNFTWLLLENKTHWICTSEIFLEHNSKVMVGSLFGFCVFSFVITFSNAGLDTKPLIYQTIHSKINFLIVDSPITMLILFGWRTKVFQKFNPLWLCIQCILQRMFAMT